MKKIISMVLVILMLCTGLAFAATVPSDVAGNVYEEAITALSEKGIITGDVDGQFHPDSRLTRAQACIMVVKAMNPPAAEVMGTPTQTIKSGFPDMAGYGWAEGYIGYAVRKGIVNGYPCLLYTSDAADEEDSVDLGGRRIIKKKKDVDQRNVSLV